MMSAMQNTDYHRYITMLLEVIIFIITVLSRWEGAFCF
jgi:hypothetical protein